MTQTNHKWAELCRALNAFRKAAGHANVPANWKPNPSLGRWVAMQRYRRKVGELTAKQIEELDRCGFVWAPTDVQWNRMFDKLLAFKKKNGHCHVPTLWRDDVHLSNWVANQRHRHRMGMLAPDRAKRLDAIGFAWAVYGKENGEKKSRAERASVPRAGVRPKPPPEEAVEAKAVSVAVSGERLYHAAAGTYVQYDGGGLVPPELERYRRKNRGEFPSYIPLPSRAVRFQLLDGGGRARKIRWSGRGAIPADVLDFVNENGSLPPYDL